MHVQIVRGKTDPIVKRLAAAMEGYARDHPSSEVELYRQNSVSVRVRVLDPGFAGRSPWERNEYVWAYLKDLSESDLSDLSMLVLLTPEETTKSIMNLEFVDPIPSRL